MSDVSSIWTVLVCLFVLACLVGNAAGWVLVLRRVADRQRRLEGRLDDLSRRLSQWERQSRDMPKPASPPRIEPPSTAPNPRSRVVGTPVLSPFRRHEPGASPSHPTLISIPDLGHEGPIDRQSGAELGQKYQAVWTLAVSGSSPEEIARRTGQPIGEIELIIGLQRSLQPAQGELPHVRSE